MVRSKTHLEKIEDYGSRLTTFSKRRVGLIKKTYELSVLCDIDVALIVFSHSGKLRHFSGHKRIEDVLTRFLKCPDAQVVTGISTPKKESLVDLLQSLKLQEDTTERAFSQQQNQNQNGSTTFEDVDLQLAYCQSRLDTLKGFLSLLNSDEPVTSPCVFEERSRKMMDLYSKVQARKYCLLNALTSSAPSMHIIQPQQQNVFQQENMDLVHVSTPTLVQQELDGEYLGWLNDSPNPFGPREGVTWDLVPPDLESVETEGSGASRLGLD